MLFKYNTSHKNNFITWNPSLIRKMFNVNLKKNILFRRKNCVSYLLTFYKIIYFKIKLKRDIKTK